jgi:hypothetical protein
VESDHPTRDPEWHRQRIERAHSAEDAMTQFRVWESEYADRAFPVLLETVEEPIARGDTDHRAGLTGLTFGQALRWLRSGARVRRWKGDGWVALRDGKIVLALANGDVGMIGDAPPEMLNDALLANDWEVISDAVEGT